MLLFKLKAHTGTFFATLMRESRFDRSNSCAKRIVREHCPVHITYNKKIESRLGRSDAKPTKPVVSHCYPGIPAELVVADGRTNDIVFEYTEGCWPEKRKK